MTRVTLLTEPIHDALPPAAFGVVFGAEPAAVSAAFDLEAVDVAPAALLGEMVADFMLGEGGDGPRDAADIPSSFGRQG